jgi:hypothetical protein
MDFSEFLQPAIFGLTGKPGAGKSYFATRLIIAEIKKGKNRPIVTNVPVNKKKLRQYVKKDFYLYELDTYTDNKAFFTNRGYYHLENIPLGANVDFKPLLKDNDEGVLFIIDEAHLYFNSRNWKHMPQATISYITTIRHVGDSLIWMCQKFSDIDSQIRGKTQAFHLLRNLQKEKLGMFKRGTGFRCYQYQEESHISAHGGDVNRACQDFKYPFEIEIAECYNTSLFNKSHDKKYRVKAIPLPYVIYTVITLGVCGIYWLATGGFREMIDSLMPKQMQEMVTETASAQIVDNNITILPVSDPFNQKITEEIVNEEWQEIPRMFGNQESENLSPWEQISETDYERKKKYWFGTKRKCKLTFISDKVTKENKTDFSFGLNWSEFAALNQVNLLQESGIWQMQTGYFNAFVTYIRDKGEGGNLKETDIIIKENIEFELVHGYQLPYQDSFAMQGVVRSSRQYKEVGFNLTLLMQEIDGQELLQVVCENTDVMDITSDQPILQSFRTSNVLDVQDGMTYQIADFRSVTSQVSKGFFKKSDYSTEITNKIFISYGDI